MDRLLLAAYSAVFRDMLEAISTDAEAEKDCPVSETHEELQILVKGLRGQVDRSEADWLTLYRLVDKYDMQPLRVLRRFSARYVDSWTFSVFRARSDYFLSSEMIDEDALQAYCAAAILGDCEIQEMAACMVVQQKINLRCVKLKIWEAAAEQERLRLVSTKLHFEADLGCMMALIPLLSLLSRRSGSSPGGKKYKKRKSGYFCRSVRSRETIYATSCCGKRQSTNFSKSRRFYRAIRRSRRPRTHRTTTLTYRSAT